MWKNVAEIARSRRWGAAALYCPLVRVHREHLNRFVAAAIVVASTMVVGGCNVQVGREERPLLRHQPIKGDLELISERRTDEQGSPGNRREAQSTVFEEKLSLSTKGDIYHPKFLLFDAAMGFGLAQQRFTADNDSDRTSAVLDEYDFHASLLPQKPYPLSGHLSRTEGLIPRQFLGSLRTETDNMGLILPLRAGSWPMTFEWNKSETKQDALGSLASDFFNRDSDRFGYSLTHDFSRLSHLSFRFDSDKVSQQSSATATDLDQKRYMLSHDWIFGSDEKHQLSSIVSSLNQSGSFNVDVFEWEERLKLQHSPTFLTNYALRLADTKQQDFTNREFRGTVGFEHKLYESLITTGSVFSAKSDLGGQGDLDTDGGVLGFNYTKKNRWGALLGSYSTALTQEEQTGGNGVGVVIDESHVFTDPLPITLDRANIDTSSIVVTDSTGLNIYTLGDDYTITEINGRVRLNPTILGSIPPNITDGQTLLVDYNFFTSPKREDRTLRQMFRLRQRFKNGLSVYYEHEKQDETVSSSVVSIAPDEFSIDTFGAEYTNKGLTLLGEYSKEASTQIPSTSKRLEARYNWRLGPDTTSDIRVSSQWLDFGEPDPRSLELLTFGSGMFSRLSSKLTLSHSFDWRDEDDSVFGNTDGLWLASELRYDYRQLHLMTGLEFNQLDRRDDRIKGIFLYCRLKRLF